MALKDLTQNDFEFYKKYASDMRTCHDREFLKMIDPELQRCFYRGRNTKYNDTDEKGFHNKREHLLTMSRIFQGVNTLGPNLYWENPQPIVIPGFDGTKEGGAYLSAFLRENMRINSAKRQNLEGALSAWFFGIGWKKMGVRSTFTAREIEPETEDKGIIEKMKDGVMGMMGMKESALETKTDYFLQSQRFFNDVEDPTNVFLDHKTTIWNGLLRLHRIKKSLFDVANSNMYEEETLKEITEKFKYNRGSRFDSREVELNVNELEIKQPNGLWILAWCDEYENKPLRYDLSLYQKGFQLEPLVFTKEPFVRYPISHMRVATQVQAQLDYLATLYIKIIDRIRNQIIIDKNALAPGMENAILRNKLGGVIFTNGPISPGMFAQLTSASVSNDLPNLMGLVQQNLTEILGTDEQLISGRSTNKTLGQDELARVGTKVRESGMLDDMRQWMIRQFEHEACLAQEFGVDEMNLQVNQRDYANLPMGQEMQESFQSFATPQQPLPFTYKAKGKYFYDLNIYEAVKPDKSTLQEEYARGIELFSRPDVKMAGMNNGVVFRVDKLAEGFADNFEYIKSRDFIEKLNASQLAALQVKTLMMNGGAGALMGGGKGKEPQKENSQSPQGVSNPSAMMEMAA